MPEGWRIEDYSSWFEIFSPMLDSEAINKSELAPSPIACKRENFDLFLQFFSEDVVFQYSNTQFPLKLILWDGTGEHDKPVELWVLPKHYSNPSFPIFPDRLSREKLNVCIRWT